MNSKKGKSIKWWVAGFLAIALMVFSIKQKSSFAIQKVAVNIAPLSDGSQLVTPKEVLLRIERKFGHQLKRMPLGKINIEQIEAELESDPFIKAAEVYVDANEIAHLNLQQQEPIFRVLNGNGDNYFVGEEGKRIPLSAQSTPRVMVVTGKIPSYNKRKFASKKGAFYNVFNLANKFNQDEFFRPLIEQIHLEDDGYTIVPKLGKQKIFLGDLEDLDDKLERLKVFYHEGLPVEGWNKYKTINLTFDGMVVCRKA